MLRGLLRAGATTATAMVSDWKRPCAMDPRPRDADTN